LSEQVRNQTLHVPLREASFNRHIDGVAAVFPNESSKKERSGKELILATKPYARESRIKSWWYTLSTLGLLIATLVGIIALPYLPLKIILSVFSSLLMSRMFVIYHDHQHHAILHRSPLANVIMTIFGIYSLAPPSIITSIIPSCSVPT
jgi:fatty acid desaturase